MREILDFWNRLYDNMISNYMEFIAITSIAQGKNTSMAKGYGVGKSSLALWISYVLHYLYYNKNADLETMDTQDKEIWNEVLEHMAYDKMQLIYFANEYKRIPAVIWDDAQFTAPNAQHVPKLDHIIAKYLTTSRTSVANFILTMPELFQLSKPFRDLINYEVIVPQRGIFEVQFIKTRKQFRNPYTDFKRLYLLHEGIFDAPPQWVYQKYLKWREEERRKVIKKYMKEMEKQLQKLGIEALSLL